MILIGTTTISLKRTTGSFFCPLCNDQRPYVKKAKKRFLTLYFIPVFPLANEGEFVQCSGCQKQFETDVLSFNPAQQEARRRSQAVAHVFRTMILVMIADGTVDDAEIEAIRRVCRELDDTEPTDDDIAAAAAAAREHEVDTLAYVEAIADELDDTFKRELVRAVFLVATAAGNLETPQAMQLTRLPALLQMPEDQYRQIIEEAI